MKLSRNFLKDYIDINDIDYTELANKMVLVGNEFENVKYLSDATNVVVGEVLECNRHPESTKLSICKVNTGEVNQILCGASNVKAGQKVVVAKIGAILPGGFEIKKAKLAGYDSEGMICSLTELGIESKYMSDEDKEGIHVLKSDAKVGENALEYLSYNDQVIDFELTSNRADLLSVIGMAYEVGAIYNKKVILPNIDYKEIEESINMNLSVETPNCSLYLGKMVKDIVIEESPYFIKARLIASGIRPINNVVDISNYVMLETGQPLHFFDALKLGNKVLVRNAKEEAITTLDNTTHNLISDDIVITDGEKPVALAGVMGGLNTEVTNSTTSIFIESAIFDSISIRNTSKRTFRTEATNRFEKGIDPNRSLFALNRACYLLEKYASGKVLKGLVSHDVTNKEDKKITISLNKVNQVLGMNLTGEEVVIILNKLGFKNEGNTILVPTRRLDIGIEEDLIEEIGRIHGYDNLLGKLPTTNVKEGKYSKKALMIKEIRNLLQSLGLNQVITYSLLKDKEVNNFVLEPKEIVTLLSPMSEDKKVMRQSLLTGLYNVYEYNNARFIKDINIFETGSIYYKKDNNYVEDTYVSGLLSGTYLSNDWQQKTIKVDFYLVKGIIENLLGYLGLNNRYQINDTNIPNGYHIGRSAAVYVDNILIGHFGQIDPRISKKEVYVFELNLELLLSLKVRNIKFKEINKYPSVTRDLSIVINKEVSSKTITDTIKKASGKLLTNIDIFDLYVGPNVLETEKSLAYSLTYEDANKTLEDNEINAILEKVKNELTNIGAKLR
jgi:phenylalanyl-tRNA synthetase beta chain